MAKKSGETAAAVSGQDQGAQGAVSEPEKVTEAVVAAAVPEPVVPEAVATEAVATEAAVPEAVTTETVATDTSPQKESLMLGFQDGWSGWV
jgi:hypothetical protein